MSATSPESSPDREIIRIAAEIVALEQEAERLARPYWSSTVALPADVSAQLDRMAWHSKNLREALSARPAITLSGWRAKANVVRLQWGQAPIADGEVAWSLVNDILNSPQAV